MRAATAGGKNPAAVACANPRGFSFFGLPERSGAVLFSVLSLRLQLRFAGAFGFDGCLVFRLDQQQDERIAAFDQKLEHDTALQIQKIQADLKKKTDDELLHLRSGTSDLLASLDNYYSKNHDTLSTQICEKLIRK